MSTDGPRQTVAVQTEVAAIDRALDYEVPEDFSGPTEPGSRVRVDLHGRSVRGWILGEGTVDPSMVALKPVRSSLGIGPPRGLIEVCEWAAWRWYSTTAKFLGTSSPDRIVKNLPRRPTQPALVVPDSELGRLGAARSTATTPGLVRLGPASDPFDLVVGFCAGLWSSGALEHGSLLIVVPGLGYAGRLTSRLSRRGIRAVEASSSWEACRAGWPVVVGTRAGAFASVPHVAGVIVLDTDDARLVAEGAPTWRATDVAVERARRAGSPALLVASCPSSFDAALAETVLVPAAEEQAGWPNVAVANRRDDDPRVGVLSSDLVELGRRALENQPEGVAVAAIVNRTGRARLLACSRCDAIARCEACDAAMVLDTQLSCPRCSATRPVICQGCGATKLKLLRLGTAQLAPELALLLGVPTVELTAASGPDALNGARAVVGTEAVLYRLRRTSLVAFLDLDHHLLAPRAGAELSALGMIARAGRLVGGRGTHGSGTILLQTKLADHQVITAAQSGDPAPVLLHDAAVRQSLGLAPMKGMARVRGAGALAFAEGVGQLGVEILPLSDDVVVLRSATHEILCDALEAAPRPKDRFVVDIDPGSI